MGTGAIANIFAESLSKSDTGKLIAVASRHQTSAQIFGKKFNIPIQYSSYDELLADPNIQVVYIALPHPFHAKWAIKSANAGKHVLCEKPLAINYSEALNVVEAARLNDIFLMEAFMYRFHPQTTMLIKLIKENAIGKIRLIQASFSFYADFDLNCKAFDNSLGGGGILDVGCYPVSMTRLIAGIALRKHFADPIEVHGTGHIGKSSNTDEWSIGCLKFSEGIVAQIAGGVHLDLENVVRIFGSDGDIYVPSPWVPGGRAPGTTKIYIHKRRTNKIKEIKTKTRLGVYSLEADTVAQHIANRQAPMMTWEDSLGNMKTLDRWRDAVGISYPADSNIS